MKPVKTLALALLAAPLLFSCTTETETTEEVASIPEAKYTLAQWSFNRDLFGGEMNTVDFINAAGEMGFDGVEYVSQFFQDKAEDHVFLDSLKNAAEAAGIRSVMIQVDNIGNLGASDEEARAKAVAEGKKWVDAAKYLGCDDIRVNAHGDGTPDEMKANCIAGIGELAAYAQTQGIGVVIENHGGISNNAAWLAGLVNDLSEYNVGSLADFNNWCTARESGRLWGGACIETYDRYQGMEELLPTARGISVKAFEFDSLGNETTMDYSKLFTLIKDSGYDGYLGVEFEGHGMPSMEGIKKNKALAERSWAAVYE